MADRTPLTPEQIEAALARLPGWTCEDDRLRKSFVFKDFREAVGFVLRLAFSAEQLEHHPEIHCVYNRVDVALCTHDAGDRVTGMDVTLARAIEAFNWLKAEG